MLLLRCAIHWCRPMHLLVIQSSPSEMENSKLLLSEIATTATEGSTLYLCFYITNFFGNQLKPEQQNEIGALLPLLLLVVWYHGSVDNSFFLLLFLDSQRKVFYYASINASSCQVKVNSYSFVPEAITWEMKGESAFCKNPCIFNQHQSTILLTAISLKRTFP